MTKRMGPGNVPNRPLAPVPSGDDLSDIDPRASVMPEEARVEYDDEMSLDELRAQLAKLREPFPEERIEKLPKPLWKGAWDNLRGSNCPVCGGYHVLQHCIHLDYVGHANVTDRLLEIDPFWSWEPMAYTPEGLPLFVKEGLWIKLTICGVTRIGFGDGASIKEVIGDAIRNAAMRFGVGLDLWAKIDLHSERNRGDGPTPQARASQPRGDGRQDRPVHADQPAAEEAPQAPRRAPNQDALDALGAVCDENGLDKRRIKQQFLNWAARESRPEGDITRAPAEDIDAFTLHLIESMEPPDDVAGDVGSAPGASVAAGAGGPEGGDTDAAAAGGDADDGVADGGAGDVPATADDAEAQDLF